jgi:hypothetical protein
MSKFAGWLLGLSVVMLTAVAAYEFAYIGHLQFIIRMLVGGSPN